ncbi:type II toxin-antitoxin system RelE/ParE family toxin [Burkholderia gladioli]|uniref:type II toxin-antitoxin system RelE/ParE family toxin n=1 Tax=Burkholderia gladioli TaxID=28095 RepID=UPI001FC84882|nr:type II toxin-antitoxin system RelE/ParE family toxin [Burkholderia gladioli]
MSSKPKQGSPHPRTDALPCNYTQMTYNSTVQATFIELPPFSRERENYLADEEYAVLQKALLANPEAGDLIKGAGSLRKLRFADKRRQKGKRGGLRVIYYYWVSGYQFWLFTLYDKDEMTDLSSDERKAFAKLLEREVTTRSKQ